MTTNCMPATPFQDALRAWLETAPECVETSSSREELHPDGSTTYTLELKIRGEENARMYVSKWSGNPDYGFKRIVRDLEGALKIKIVKF